MNDIYWHDKRSVSSKQLTSSQPPPPTQPRRSYENTLRTKQYQQTDTRVNSQSRTNRNIPSPYIQYPTVSNRSHNHNGNFPYTSSLHGVYRQSPPPQPSILISPSALHNDRRIDSRNQSHDLRHRQLSRSVSEDYYRTKFQELNGYNDDMYDENEDENDENSFETFSYTFNDPGVSLQKISRNIF